MAISSTQVIKHITDERQYRFKNDAELVQEGIIKESLSVLKENAINLTALEYMLMAYTERAIKEFGATALAATLKSRSHHYDRVLENNSADNTDYEEVKAKVYKLIALVTANVVDTSKTWFSAKLTMELVGYISVCTYSTGQFYISKGVENE